MMSMMRSSALALAVLALAGCGETARTQVMLVVDADPAIHAASRVIEVQIQGRAPGGVLEGDFTRTFELADTGWPIEIAILPAGGDAAREWRAQVRALDGTDVIVRATVISGFVAGRTLAYPLLLEGACRGVAPCAAEETCRAGACVAARVPLDRLIDYTPPVRADAGQAIDAGAPDAAIDGGSDGGSDAGSDGGMPCLPTTNQVDLLLMIDNSNSMAEEQSSLTNELPALVRALSTGDLDGDSLPEFAPIDSLHIGVISSDMGSGGAALPSCDRGAFGPTFGDDGVLLAPRPGVGGCAAVLPRIFEFMTGESADTFAAQVACATQLGTGGCGIELPLEATLKALTPATAQPWTADDFTPIAFFEGTTGHGADANAGLVRNDSVLAMVLLTDEEDCSWVDPALVNPSSSVYTEDLNLRCFAHPEALYPVTRYVDGLLDLRRDRRRLVFAAIAGIPPDLDPGSSPPSYTSILADPRMVEQLDTSGIDRLVPSCDVVGRGVAFPPRRILQVARGLSDAVGPATTVHSICQSSYAPAIRRIVELIGTRVDGTCG